jgi:uncharacterized protein (DUF2062 family)
MRYLSAIISFVVLFVFAFALGGFFLMPFLPPTPDHSVHFFEAEYWTTNWAGIVLGLVLGGLSARSLLKGASTKPKPIA